MMGIRNASFMTYKLGLSTKLLTFLIKLVAGGV
jgi:hypothetical protein